MKNSFLIGISGGSGSGKTAFINSLRNAFTSSELGLLSEDNYYFPEEFQKKDENGVFNFDIPEAIDHDAFIKDLGTLYSGQSIERMEYNFNNDGKIPKICIVHPAPVLLLEGLFIFYKTEISAQLDLRILIDAKENLKIARRIQRDQMERNYPIEDVLYRYQHHVTPAFEKFIYPYLGDVHLIINNNISFSKASEVLSAFISSLLNANKTR